MRTAAVLLAMPTLAWLLALLSVNSDTLLCHYLFAASNCLQVSGNRLRLLSWNLQSQCPWGPQRLQNPKASAPGIPNDHDPWDSQRSQSLLNLTPLVPPESHTYL